MSEAHDRLMRLARDCYVDAHSEEHPLVREGRILARLRELVGEVAETCIQEWQQAGNTRPEYRQNRIGAGCVASKAAIARRYGLEDSDGVLEEKDAAVAREQQVRMVKDKIIEKFRQRTARLEKALEVERGRSERAHNALRDLNRGRPDKARAALEDSDG
jgi:hypothetical protein